MAAPAVPTRFPLRSDVDQRVAELIRNIGEACRRHPGEDQNRANKRLAEEFLARIQRDYPGRCIARRQAISAFDLRTTDANYVFTVPGRSPDELVLVAHFDTWRGPGADDNTTGEEILKQYLLEDLRRDSPPPLTHTYVLAGSEECGMIGFFSQCLLAAGLVAANIAWNSGNVVAAGLALLAVPLSKYRFGVAGSRVYVRSQSGEQLARTRAVLAVDSVGEGRLYILRESLGADFVRAFIPFTGYERINSLLEEGAHLHGIKYNSFISGGTTDHVSWMEVNNSLLDRLRERLGGAPKPKIPAAALIAMCPGKASPFVFGGKIHTPNDTPDRIYPEPLRESLHVIDYFFHIAEGGARPVEPRKPAECHYARLYEMNGDHYLAMKDAIEPNQRNINMLYRVSAEVTEDGPDVRASVAVQEVAGWGVATSLDEEMDRLAAGHLPGLQPAANPAPAQGEWRRLPVTEIHMAEGPVFLRRFGLVRRLRSLFYKTVGTVEEWMGRYSFAVFFLAAYLVAQAFNIAMIAAFSRFPEIAMWFFDWVWVTAPAAVIVQFGVIAYLFAVAIPTWIDNSYKRLNRADNLTSLKRANKQEVRSQEPEVNTKTAAASP